MAGMGRGAHYGGSALDVWGLSPPISTFTGRFVLARLTFMMLFVSLDSSHLDNAVLVVCMGRMGDLMGRGPPTHRVREVGESSCASVCIVCD